MTPEPTGGISWRRNTNVTWNGGLGLGRSISGAFARWRLRLSKQSKPNTEMDNPLHTHHPWFWQRKPASTNSQQPPRLCTHSHSQGMTSSAQQRTYVSMAEHTFGNYLITKPASISDRRKGSCPVCTPLATRGTWFRPSIFILAEPSWRSTQSRATHLGRPMSNVPM